MKFRKKPVVIDAWQWHCHGDHEKVTIIPLSEGGPHGECRCERDYYDHGWLETLSGGVIVCPGEWIVKGIQNEFYPCHPEIFKMTYEPVEEEPKKIWPYYKCPKCGSFKIGQNRSLFGKMWCVDCGYYVNAKEAKPNPFEMAFELAVKAGEKIPKPKDNQDE